MPPTMLLVCLGYTLLVNELLHVLYFTPGLLVGDVIISPQKVAKYCDQRVCLFVCPLACLKNHIQISLNFRTCYLWPWLRPFLTAV